MSGSVEVALTEERVEQARAEKVNADDRTEQVTNGVNEKDRGILEARVEARDEEARDEEASVGGNGDVLDSCSGLGPSVGIIFNYWSAKTVAAAVKKLNNKIRITLALPNLDGLTEDEKRILQSAEILLVQPSAIGHSPLIHDLPNLKWMHSLTAGVDHLLHTNELQTPPPPFILTRNVGPFHRQMADFVVTMIIARERHFREFWENQRKKIWVSTMARPLTDLSIGIVGFGIIGKEVARVAKFFGLRVWALVRSLPTESTKCTDVDEYRLLPDLGDVLSSCDYVVSVLPSTPSTNGFFDGDTLSKGKTKKPVFMNIGRGNVVKNSTILHALNQGWISHAILDVFEQEPLPSDSPLWSHPQVTITPHNSQTGFKDELFLRSFFENYKRYINGKPLLYTVDWNKGY